MASLAKRFAEMDERIDAITPIQGEGIEIEPTPAGAIISADPEPPPLPFVPIALTAGPDAEGFYTCSVYGNGTRNAATLTGQTAWIWGLYVATTGLQGFWLARLAVKAVASVDAGVWEVIPNLPIVPDATYTYVLMAVAGVVQWVKAGDCDVAASTSPAP